MLKLLPCSSGSAPLLLEAAASAVALDAAAAAVAVANRSDVPERLLAVVPLRGRPEDSSGVAVGPEVLLLRGRLLIMLPLLGLLLLLILLILLLLLLLLLLAPPALPPPPPPSPMTLFRRRE